MIYQLLLIALCGAILAEEIPAENAENVAEAARDECYRAELRTTEALLERIGMAPKARYDDCIPYHYHCPSKYAKCCQGYGGCKKAPKPHADCGWQYWCD